MTIRNIDEHLRRAIESEAATRRTSLNRAVLTLLRKATGLDHQETGRQRAFDDLDDLAGTWSDDEAAAFDRALADQRTIEEHLWQPGS